MQFGHLTLLSFLIFAWVCLLILIRTKFEPTINNSRPATIHLDINDYNNVDDGPQTPKKPEKTTKLRKYHVPRFMLELYEKNKIRDNCSDTPPDIVRSLIPKHTGSFDDDNEVLQELSDNHLLIFDLPTSNEGEEFVGAELKILTMVEIGSNAVVLGVERQLKISVYDDTTRKLYHLQKISVYHYNNTWLSFNLTQPVIKVLQKKSKSKYLKVVVSISTFLPHYYETANKFKLSLMPIADDFEHDYPVLLLTYASNKTPAGSKQGEGKKETRRKRSLEDDYEEETNNVWDNESAKRFQMKKMKRLKNTCRKKPLYVNFAEIDYDLWIVQPPGYEAYQCQGKCFYPVAEHLNPTKHAIVQALLHSVSPGKASRSCCVPTMLDSISILYVDGNGVLTYRYAYKDMVVVECGCR